MPVIDYPRLFADVKSHRAAYQDAEPFPHIVLDNFLRPEVLNEVVASFPEPEHESWTAFTAASENGVKYQQNKFHYQLGRGVNRGKPGYLEYEVSLNETIRQLLLELNSITFLIFLQNMTGLPDLIGDPKMVGGGLHQTGRGGLLRVHADFLQHPQYGFDRRLNLLLYLNKEWPSEWQGELELWSEDMQRCVKKIEPVANRCVVFTTSKTSFHGHSTPLACPENVFRRSLAMYYYTNAAADIPKPVTDWQRLPGE